MYAVIETGGKQYKAEKGARLRLEHLDGDVGGKVEIERVLLVSDGDRITVGKPLVAGAKVIGEVERQGRGRKVMVYKYMPRKHSDKLRGHRQSFTQIKILDVVTA